MEDNVISLDLPGEDESGYVYMFHAVETHFVKIGWTRQTVQSRLTEIQTSCPYKLHVLLAVWMPDPQKIEANIHKKLAAYRMQGEWFDLPDALLQACETFAELFFGKQRLSVRPMLYAPTRIRGRARQDLLEALDETPRTIRQVMQAMEMPVSRYAYVRKVLSLLVHDGEASRSARGQYVRLRSHVEIHTA